MGSLMKFTGLLSGAAVLCRDKDGEETWFLIKQADSETWEFPKVIARKGESSVRAVLRTMGEKGSMTTRIIEEAARFESVATVGGKTVPQRLIYYLLLLRSIPNEAIGFEESEWLDFAKASRRLSEKERRILKEARVLYRNWKKERKANNLGTPDEEDFVEEPFEK